MASARKEPGTKLAPGLLLGGKYDLVRRIAVGGMGEIWVAKNRMTDARVALKVLLGQDAHDGRAARNSGADADLVDEEIQRRHRLEVEPRFRHEAKLGAMLAHRNIVKIFDFIEEPDGALILVMELLRGETLLSYMEAKGPLEAATAVAIVLPLLSALEHAHESGVVHRDLKPANIILDVDPDGHVTPKLLDFGIAKVPLAGVATLDGRVLGTPQYMSPEQIRSDAKIDGRSDLFTIGVLVVHMLTGVSPFDAGSASASLAAVLETPIDPDPRIDPRLWLVLQRTLAKRPYERFATAGELAVALRAAVPSSDAELASTLRRSKPPPPSARLEEDVQPLAVTTGRSASLSAVNELGLKPSRRGVIAMAVGVIALAAFALVAVVGGKKSSETRPPVAAAASTQPTTDVAPTTAPSSTGTTTSAATTTATSTSPAAGTRVVTSTTSNSATSSPPFSTSTTSRTRPHVTAPKPSGKKTPVATHADF